MFLVIYKSISVVNFCDIGMLIFDNYFFSYLLKYIFNLIVSHITSKISFSKKIFVQKFYSSDLYFLISVFLKIYFNTSSFLLYFCMSTSIYDRIENFFRIIFLGTKRLADNLSRKNIYLKYYSPLISALFLLGIPLASNISTKKISSKNFYLIASQVLPQS